MVIISVFKGCMLSVFLYLAAASDVAGVWVKETGSHERGSSQETQLTDSVANYLVSDR